MLNALLEKHAAQTAVTQVIDFVSEALGPHA
jgi:hypothetical protein